MLGTHCVGDAVYMWRCVHVMQVVSCTCDDVYTLCRWCCVHVVLCTFCTYGTGVHVVLCACNACCVASMWYYVCVLCSCGIVTCVLVLLYSIYVYVLCCTSGVGVCIVWWCTLDVGICIVLFCTPGGCMCVIHTMCMCTWFRRKHWLFVRCGNRYGVHTEKTKVEVRINEG